MSRLSKLRSAGVCAVLIMGTMGAMMPTNNVFAEELRTPVKIERTVSNVFTDNVSVYNQEYSYTLPKVGPCAQPVAKTKIFQAATVTVTSTKTTVISGHTYNLSPGVQIAINDKLVLFTDVTPVMDNTAGRVLVPFRKIAEELGYQVTWIAASQEVEFKTSEITAKLKIGSDQAVVNGVAIKLDTNPVIINGRTVVPIRFLAEAFACGVDWSGTLKTVYIDTTASEGLSVDEQSLFDSLVVQSGGDGASDGLENGVPAGPYVPVVTPGGEAGSPW